MISKIFGLTGFEKEDTHTKEQEIIRELYRFS